MRCVLDTNIVVAAMRSPTGASAALLAAARHGELTMLANVALALEYEATCRLEKDQSIRRYPNTTWCSFD